MSTAQRWSLTVASFGWEVHDETWFSDSIGHRFSLLLSSLTHIRALLLRNWGYRVGQAVKHRKGLEQVEAIDLDFSRPSKPLLPSERGLMAAFHDGH